MSVDGHDPAPGAEGAAVALLRRAAAADARAERRLAAAAADLVIADDDRLDDELRAIIGTMLARLIDTIEADLRHYAGRALAGGDGAPLSAAGRTVDRLVAAGLLDDRDLVAEIVERAWSAILADRLPPAPPGDPDRPSLLPRLAGDPDRVVASAASALMATDARRRGPGPDTGRNDLSAELHHRLVWWTAAALRPEAAVPGVDAALTDAARRVLSAHDEGLRIEAAAQRLAAALDPSAEAIGALIEESLADRRIVLFIALLAERLGIEAPLVRRIVLDPDGDRLLLALRAAALPREAMIRIGLALCEADRRRDPEALAAAIDTLTVMPVERARDALAPLRLPAEYRRAAQALDRPQ